ncbi:MAG: helix-turn-helix domain-containing protein [Betaproteobacteria bacterium]|nr:MAG: helix-turn-helix domain-containing protein [Betaproteobacteria bacterium]
MSELSEENSTPSDSPGAILHAERRRQKFSVGDVSRHLKLSVRQVEALERDEYQMFGGPVFVHGFLRNYAKLLGVDATSLIASADQRLATRGETIAAEQDSGHEEAGQQPAGDDGQKSVVPLFIAAAILIAGIAGWVLSRDEEPAPEEDEASMVAQQESAGATASSGDAPMTEPGAEISAEVPQPEPAASGAVPSTTGASPTPVVKEGPRSVLRFDFFDESWVEVTDRYGEIIYSDLNPPGVSQRISGHPPLTIVIGNAAGTVLTYNDEAIDLAPYTRVDVARLTLE